MPFKQTDMIDLMSVDSTITASNLALVTLS